MQREGAEALEPKNSTRYSTFTPFCTITKALSFKDYRNQPRSEMIMELTYCCFQILLLLANV